MSKRNTQKVDKTKKHYRLVHFYARNQEPVHATLQGAMAACADREHNSTAETYTQLWEMSNETDGEMVGFFENGIPASIAPDRLGKAKLLKA